MFSSAWVSPDRIDLKDEKIVKKNNLSLELCTIFVVPL
jgi:hypothetical protein